MLCENCHINEASVFYTESIYDTENSYNLCQECFEKKVHISTIETFFDHFFSKNIPQNNVHNDYTCDKCGNTLNKFKKTGRFGCANCYVAFGDKLEPFLQSTQGEIEHIGKYPKNFSYEDNEIDILSKKLQDALKIEDYELAIKLRDKIKALKGGISDEMV